MSLPQIALVEDEQILREELTFQLGHFGFPVEAFATSEQLYRRLAVKPFAVVILDIGLAGEDGLSVCRYLREHDRDVGIVFVSARALREERLVGLDAGADAYLPKPVDLDELVLVLRRLLERNFLDNDRAAAATSGWCWRLDNSGDFLLAPSGNRIRLAINEARLLKVLLDKPGEVAVARDLAAGLGLLPEEYDKHRVEVIISRLRDKVLRETGHPLPVLTRRGLGYMFLPETP
jgi:DNA-binding response OmpR family regulator